MTGAAVLSQLKASGIELRAEGSSLIAKPKSAVTEELRALMHDHKAELLDELRRSVAAVDAAVVADVADLQGATHRQPPAPSLEPSAGSGYDCTGCDRLEMVDEPQPGTRRRFHWRCQRGHALLEARNWGSRIILAPRGCEEAGDFKPWQPGTR